MESLQPGSIQYDAKIEQAKYAYDQLDGDLSTLVHKQKVASSEHHSGAAGDFISSIVFGGLDGIITTFAVIAAAVGSHLPRGIVLIVGFANLLGDAIGMAVGDYISTKAESDHVASERLREEWETENCLENEILEMRAIYEKKGLTSDDAAEVVDLLLENKKVFVDVMMVEELGLMPPEDGNPVKGAAVTFGAFMLCGSIPMFAYIGAGDYHELGAFDVVFGISIILFGVTLFALGAFRGHITKKRWYLTGLTMLVNGCVTTAIAYVVGDLLQEMVKV